MSLSLTLNGSTTTTIPGSPATADRIAMSNGTLRVSFVYQVHATSPARWWLDLVEYSSNGGSTWQTVFYVRDSPRCNVNGGSGDIVATNAALSIITNTASQLTLQFQASNTVASGTNSGTTITLTSQYTMTTSAANVEVSQFAASSAQLTLTSNQYLEEWGSGYITTGLGSATLAMYDGVQSTFDANRTNPILLTGNRVRSRYFARPANVNARSFHGGACIYFANGMLATFVMKPASYRNLTVGITDPNTTTPQAAPEWHMSHGGYNSFIVGTDNAYHAQTDTTSAIIRPGSRFGNSSAGTTFPLSASSTDATTTLNFTWSLVVETPTTGGGSDTLPVPRYIFPQTINRWADTLYARPNVAAQWQSLTTLESTILPVLASTYTTFFDTTYGYWEQVNSATIRHNFSNALALQAVLRHANLNIGNGATDALAMADILAVCIANYQSQSGAQQGAIQKTRNTGVNTFTCQDTTHAANGDQPHVSMYTMAEAVYALIEYFKVRGNRTLVATYGSTTVAAVLDAAMAYLLSVQTSDGGWLVEYNNVNTATSTNGRIGRNYPGSSTVDLAASLLSWAQSSPTASASSKTSWLQASRKAIEYWLASEVSAHGAYEYGEDYVNYSSHAAKMLMRGFARLYKMTGNSRFQEWMAFYYEIGIFLCKHVDEVLNNSGSANQDIHVGGMMSTIDFSGIEAGEITNSWALMLSETLNLHPNPLAHDYFYLYVSLTHMTYAYRDAATYLSSYPFSYAYCSPGTVASGFATGIDNTRFTYFGPGMALMLIPVQSLIGNSNPLVLATCLEGNEAGNTPVGRTIVLYNPQSGSQSVNLTVRGQAGKTVQQDGVTVAGTKSGADLLVALTLTSGQVSKVTTR